MLFVAHVLTVPYVAEAGEPLIRFRAAISGSRPGGSARGSSRSRTSTASTARTARTASTASTAVLPPYPRCSPGRATMHTFQAPIEISFQIWRSGNEACAALSASGRSVGRGNRRGEGAHTGHGRASRGIAVLAWAAPSALGASRPQRGGAATATPVRHLSGASHTAVVIGVVVVLVALVVFLIRLLSRRAGVGGRVRPGGGTPPGASTDGTSPADPSTAEPSTDDLWTQAASALVATDDAVRTSEQELGFATATVRRARGSAVPGRAAIGSGRAERRLQAPATARRRHRPGRGDDAVPPGRHHRALRRGQPPA